MCEIELILNDRLVTKNSDKHNDLEALTQNSLFNETTSIFTARFVHEK